MKICFAASSGGHLEQLMMLNPLMKKYDNFIITEKTKYKFKSSNPNVYKVSQINRREIFFLIKIITLIIYSIFIFLKEKPDVVISTGALATIPICIIAKLFKKKVIFIESFSKINSPTISGRLMYKIADLFLIQWEDLYEFYPKATYGGGIY